MLDDMREVMGDALAYLGYSVNTKNPLEIEKAKDLINNSASTNC
jgi:spermidine/putrescine transport system substrate-binding protein